MHDLEERLRERSTEDLQGAFYRNELIPEASDIAKCILSERGVSIPMALTEEETNATHRAILRRSNVKFWLFVATIIGWFIYAEAFDLFASGNGERLQHSVFVTGLFLAIELGFVKSLR